MKAPNVVSLSGGKDSTAMLLMLLERKEPIADIVFFDTGWEFAEMYDHLNRLETLIGRKITRLRPRLPIGVETEKVPFDWYFSECPVKKRGTNSIHMIGRGWPRADKRWCTGMKQKALKAHLLALTHRAGFKLPLRQCVGFAADETERMHGITKSDGLFHVNRYPLIEWGITERDAIHYCKKQGFDWGGLYDMFDRVSCFCCPLQRINDLKMLRGNFPELWERMLLMESWLPKGTKRIFGHYSVSDLENRFSGEEHE